MGNTIRDTRMNDAVQKSIERLEPRRLLAAAGPDPYGYVADVHPYEEIDLERDPAAGQVRFKSGFGDTTTLLDNTFNFYGHVYSGDLPFKIEREGLIRFGAIRHDTTHFNPEYNHPFDGPTPGAARVYPPAIAPLWNGGIKPITFAKLQDTGGPDARPDRLIIQWSWSEQFNFTLRFHTILELNTGNRPGDIIFNYANLSGGGFGESVVPAAGTVGIKDAGLISSKLILSHAQPDNPLVGSGKAIRIHNTAGAGRPVADVVIKPLQEGFPETSIGLDGRRHTRDPDQSASSLRYEWDLDLDGVYGETGTNAANGDEAGPHPRYTAPFLNHGTIVRPVVLRVTDADGNVSYDDSSLLVKNAPPTPTITGPDTVAAGVPFTINLSATDPGPDDSPARFSVTWDDEAEGVFSHTLTTSETDNSATHSYSRPGTYTIKVTAVDVEHSPPVSKTITVTDRPAADTLNPFGVLFITAGDGDDTITVDQQGDSLRVNRNGTITTHPFTQVRGVDIDAGGGNNAVSALLPLYVTVYGGDGNDTITTGAGHDFIDAGAGNNTIAVGDGGGRVNTGAGNDLLTTPSSIEADLGDGDNHIEAGGGLFVTGDGNDTILASDDALDFGFTVDSGAGDDSIITGDGADHINCGDGADTVITGGRSDSVVAGGDAAAGIGAFIDTGDVDDSIFVDYAATILAGAGDDDVMAGAADSVSGGAGDDRITVNLFIAQTVDAGAGNDLVRVNSDAAHSAVIVGGDGDDRLSSSGGRDSLHGNAGRDTLYGGDASDLLSGGGGNDLLFGQSGPDRLYGAAGNDRLFGQRGDDRLTGGAGTDRLDGGAGIDSGEDDDLLDVVTAVEA